MSGIHFFLTIQVLKGNCNVIIFNFPNLSFENQNSKESTLICYNSLPLKTILNESNISKPSKLVYFLILFLKKIDFIDKNVLKQINMNNLLEKTDVV